MPQKILNMKQLVNLPRSPENQEHARISCNAELHLKHHGEGELALLQVFQLWGFAWQECAVWCGQGFTLGHRMALSYKKSCMAAAWKTTQHSLPGKKQLTESISGKPSWKGCALWSCQGEEGQSLAFLSGAKESVTPCRCSRCCELTCGC